MAMRRVGIVALLGTLMAGCMTPIVLENPATSERVNCTVEAERLVYGTPNQSPGTDVPQKSRPAPTLSAFDLERQCAGELMNAGFVCLTGCRDLPH
jgi:hypothetical protein